MLIRKARDEDIDQIVELGRALHTESPRYCNLDFSPSKVAALAAGLIHGAVSGDVIVAELNGKLAGMIAFIVTEHFFGIDKLACDLTVYVAPEHRGSTAYIRLVTAFEQKAKELGAVEFQLGVSTGIHAAKTTAMQERIGYKQVGYINVKVRD